MNLLTVVLLALGATALLATRAAVKISAEETAINRITGGKNVE